MSETDETWRMYPAEASCAPKGHRLAYNGKSRFSGEYKSKWVRADDKPETTERIQA